MNSKKYIKQLGYEYICVLLETSSKEDALYKLLVRRKKYFERRMKRLIKL